MAKPKSDLLNDLLSFAEANPPRKCRVCRSLSPEALTAVDGALAKGISRGTIVNWLHTQGYDREMHSGHLANHAKHAKA